MGLVDGSSGGNCALDVIVEKAMNTTTPTLNDRANKKS